MGDRPTSGGSAGAPAWMATFADMMSLLLTFFVLLLSFAEMDMEKFRDALGSINAALGNTPPSLISIDRTSSSVAPMQAPVQTPLRRPVENITKDMLMKELQSFINRQGLEKDVEVEDSARGVVLRVRGKMFFNAGTADLKPESYPVLETISELINKFDRRVAIEGHTDNLPMSAGRYSSNWELSTARAYSALKALQRNKNLDISSINIGGFSDTRPVTSNDSPEGRARNRRVEFVFYEE